MSIRIVTDSNCDLPEEVIEEYGITSFLSISTHVGAGAAGFAATAPGGSRDVA